MEEPKPGSPAGVSSALTVRDAHGVQPLATLQDLDSATLATLVDDAKRHEKIVQWFSIGGSALLGGMSLASMLNFLPTGPAGIAVSLGVSVVSLASTGGYLLSQHRNWIRECAELGMSSTQARKLRRRLNAARRQVYPNTRHLTENERNALVIELVQKQNQSLPEPQG